MSSVVSRIVELGKVVDHDRLSILDNHLGKCSLRMRSAFSFSVVGKRHMRIVLDTIK